MRWNLAHLGTENHSSWIDPAAGDLFYGLMREGRERKGEGKGKGKGKEKDIVRFSIVYSCCRHSGV